MFKVGGENGIVNKESTSTQLGSQCHCSELEAEVSFLELVLNAFYISLFASFLFLVQLFFYSFDLRSVV